MEPLVMVLRPLHILLGIVWVGFGALTAWVMHPAAQKRGADGLAMLSTFYGHSAINLIMPIASIGTTLAGLIMWPLQTVNGYDLLAFSRGGDIVMGIGAVVGILAFGHGAAATGRYSGMFKQAALQQEASPDAQNTAALEQAAGKLYLHANISAWLAVIAAVCMSSARYLPF